VIKALSAFVGARYGTQQALNVALEAAVVATAREQRALLAVGMPHRAITAAEYWSLVNFKTNHSGMNRLGLSGRLYAPADTIQYMRRLDDFAVLPVADRWESVQLGTGLVYVVQTSTKAIERCLLLATDPGDLVLDPTCGSGTRAYVAEQWGRRWMTIDTSRVALAPARARIMGARYPYYLLADSRDDQLKEAAVTRTAPSSQLTRGDIRHGFVYERVPHITLKAIANNTEIDVIWDKWQATLAPLREQLNAILVGWVERSETHLPPAGADDGFRSRSTHPTNASSGTVTRPDLVTAAREAGDADFDVLIACAFNYEAHATEFSKLGRIPVLKERMNADLHMAEDLKTTGKGNLFVIFGEPDLAVISGQWLVTRDGRFVANYERVKELSGFGSLEEINGPGRDGLSGRRSVSAGGEC